MITLWIVVFVVSLLLLVKSADWLLESSERIGLSVGISPFVMGVTVIAFGTSFPELISSFVAVSQGVTEIVTANAVGSNIANILLVVGLSAIVGKKLVVTKNLIDLDLPLIALGTTIFAFLAWDGQVTLLESVVLLVTYLVYLGFTILYKDEHVEKPVKDRPKISTKDIVILFIGIIGLGVGAKYLIDAVIMLSKMFDIAPGIISVTAVAFGTSLPELLVSGKAAMQGKSEVALGNIFGSNIFNLLVVVGLPGLFATLNFDAKTLSIAMPMLIISTVLFIISGISRKIHIQEGVLYVILYLLFIAKLFEIL
ncbi:MAG: cation:H+ antiporter [Candidatus Paceibacteria bacterium]|jgi:cation:H+ antiporter